MRSSGLRKRLRLALLRRQGQGGKDPTPSSGVQQLAFLFMHAAVGCLELSCRKPHLILKGGSPPSPRTSPRRNRLGPGSGPAKEPSTQLEGEGASQGSVDLATPTGSPATALNALPLFPGTGKASGRKGLGQREKGSPTAKVEGG